LAEDSAYSTKGIKMSNLNVGDKVLFHGKELSVVNRWGAGKYHTYVFSDGTQVNFDPVEAVKAGTLTLLTKEEPETPKALKSVFRFNKNEEKD